MSKEKKNKVRDKGLLAELQVEDNLRSIGVVHTDLKVKATAELQKEIEAELEVADPKDNE